MKYIIVGKWGDRKLKYYVQVKYNGYGSDYSWELNGLKDNATVFLSRNDALKVFNSAAPISTLPLEIMPISNNP